MDVKGRSSMLITSESLSVKQKDHQDKVPNPNGSILDFLSLISNLYHIKYDIFAESCQILQITTL